MAAHELPCAYHFNVIQRFYVHNFRCLENFELPVSGQSSTLLIGNNGVGKTTVAYALELLRNIARGKNQIGELVVPGDFTRGRTDTPMRFEIEVKLESGLYGYVLALEFPKGFKELRILSESLSLNGSPVYTRDGPQVTFARKAGVPEAHFNIDWHLVALPIIQSDNDPLSVFRLWLARMLILRPVPGLILGDSDKETLEPNIQVTDFAAWFSGVVAYAPSAYARIDTYLRQVMPDLLDIKNPVVGSDVRSLRIQFANEQGSLTVPFRDLSDGEKCFMICAMVIAASTAYGPVFCYWDEPDNFLALSEVGHFVLSLRKTFQSGGQFIAASHNPEAIRQFSNDNTLLLHRKSHMEPTLVRRVSDLQISGDLVGALIRGDLEP